MTGIEFIADLAVVMVAAALAGLLCRKAGLSPIVGYLLAGIIIGPYTPPFSLVNDEDRIQVLAQVGMVFLMFSIGLGFSLRRLRQLGVPLISATALTALTVLLICRVAGTTMGMGHVESLFLAGMLMVSSSAVIAKVLQETNTAHTRWGQVALGITLSEDIVAVVMLTLLGSYIQLGGGESSQGIFETLGLMAGFILLLIILGLLFVPWMLKLLGRFHSRELETLAVAGLLFLLAWTAVQAGYSLALGAFILGTIIAETSRRAQVERSFSGLKDVFSTVFFVAIGMSIDVRMINEAWTVLIFISVLALVGRVLAASLGLLLIGTDPKPAFRSALCLTPLGEFSFIIAQLGVYAAVLPTRYYVAAVGASILTSLVAPVCIKYSGQISDMAGRVVGRWAFPGRVYLLYQKFLQEAARRQEGSLLWKLCRKRLIQIILEVLLITALLAFSQPVLRLVAEHIPYAEKLDIWLDVSFWTLLGLMVLPPLIAIWRNIDALSMIMSDFALRVWKRNSAFGGVLAMAVRAAGVSILVLWFWSFIPVQEGRLWVLLAVVLLMLLLGILFWRKLVFWHSQYEFSVETALRFEQTGAEELADRLAKHGDWPVDVAECTLPDQFFLAGQPIANCGLRQRFGVTIAQLERQNFSLGSPQPTTHLFPGDRLLLLGPKDQLPKAQAYLLGERENAPVDNPFADLVLESVVVPADCPHANRSLAEWQITRRFGVQAAGLQRSQERRVDLNGQTVIQAEDVLLILGTHEQIEQLRQWLGNA